MIYLYGLLHPDAALSAASLDTLAGVTGPIKARQLPEGWLLYGDAETDDILPKRRVLLAHTRVLEAVLQHGTVLPMRFGMFAASLDEVARLVAARAKDITASFNRLQGQVEFGLRISFPRDPALAATLSDAPRLQAERDRLSRYSKPPQFDVAEFGRRLAEALDLRRAEVQKALVSALAPDWTEYVLKSPDSDVQVLAADVLIPAADQATLAHRAEAAASQLAAFAEGHEPEVRLVGPVPAYSFVRLSLAEPAQQAA